MAHKISHDMAVEMIALFDREVKAIERKIVKRFGHMHIDNEIKVVNYADKIVRSQYEGLGITDIFAVK